MMEFTDLLDEYLELKAADNEHRLISEHGVARLNEVAHEINARIRGNRRDRGLTDKGNTTIDISSI